MAQPVRLPPAVARASPRTQRRGTGHRVHPFEIDHGAPPSVADTDHDGLTNQFEALFGTDPKLADTDHDGLSDAYETGVTHTSAISADTDHDGLSDSYEVSGRSNPGQGAVPAGVRTAAFGGLRTLDSDKDGLSDAYEQKHGTNPLKRDSDKDGLTDGSEISAGSDPLTMDSDHDGLTDRFEADHHLPADPDTDQTDLDDHDHGTV